MSGDGEPEYGEVLIGTRGEEHLAIRPVGPPELDPADAWGGCVACRILVSVAGFRGEVETALLPFGLAQLRTGLARLHEDLRGEFRWEEDVLKLRFRMDRLGHLTADGRLVEPAAGARLEFQLGLDQSFLPGILAALDRLLGAAPPKSP